MQPETIATEIFLLPAAGHAEKAGSFTNTQRMLQFREKAVDPRSDCRSETWFMYHLGLRLKARAEKDRTARNAALNALTWHYKTEGPYAAPDAEDILAEINGFGIDDRQQLSGYK